MRLIDADEVRLQKGFFEKVTNVPKFYEWLDSLPTVDAVPVVRCEDCLMHGVCRFELGLGLDGFCSQGKRKES